MCCRGSEASPFRGVPRGETPLGDSLVTFSSGRKSPGCRAERLHKGGVQRRVHRRCGPSLLRVQLAEL